LLFVAVKSKKLIFLFVLPINFVFLLACQNLFGQQVSKLKNSETLKAELIDSFQRDAISSEDADSRIDNLSFQLSKHPNSSAFVIIYCGKVCSYGEIEAHLRGIENTLTYKKLDKKRFIIISGGFREQATSELWLVRENDCPPTPTSTVKVSEVKFKGMFKRKMVIYHFSGA